MDVEPVPAKGDTLRSIRERRGMTQKALADLLQVTSRTVQNWEAGSAPIPHAVSLLLRYIERYGMPKSRWIKEISQ